jgi:hypothetical protein
MAAIVAAACAGSLDENAAIAAAVEASELRDPISLVVVESGRAGELNHGVPGSVAANHPAEVSMALERSRRPAWRVVLTGVLASRTKCLEIIIDRDSGAVLYSTSDSRAIGVCPP